MEDKRTTKPKRTKRGAEGGGKKKTGSDHALSGIVATCVRDKGYIQGDDGISYLFFNSDIANGVEKLRAGAVVGFTPKLSDSGHRAINVVVSGEEVIQWVNPEKFILAKGQPKYGKVFLKAPSVCCSSESSPDHAKGALIRFAKGLKANAIVDLRYSKSTGEDGNYKYSIHNYCGAPALVFEKRYTTRRSKAKESDAFVRRATQQMSKKVQEYNEQKKERAKQREKTQAEIFWAVIVVLLVLVLVAIGSGSNK